MSSLLGFLPEVIQFPTHMLCENTKHISSAYSISSSDSCNLHVNSLSFPSKALRNTPPITSRTNNGDRRQYCLWCATYSYYIPTTSECFGRFYVHHQEVKPYVRKSWYLFFLDDLSVVLLGLFQSKDDNRPSSKNKLCIKLVFLYTITCLLYVAVTNRFTIFHIFIINLFIFSYDTIYITIICVLSIN